MCNEHQLQHEHAHLGVNICICDIYNSINKPVGVQRSKMCLNIYFLSLALKKFHFQVL